MVTKVHLDRAGRVSLPKSLRQKLQLEAGDAFEVQFAGDEITLKPVRKRVPIRKEQGVWVYRSGQPVTASLLRLISDAREEGDSALLDERK